MSSPGEHPPSAVRSPPSPPLVNRRSYSCYNCNFSFFIVPVTTTIISTNFPTRTAAASISARPSSFRCPQCHHRHIIPNYTISTQSLPPPPRVVRAESWPPRAYPTASDEDDDDGDGDGDGDGVNNDDDDGDDDGALMTLNARLLLIHSQNLDLYIDSLPIMTFPLNTTRCCSICMEDFGVDLNKPFVVVNQLPCQHCFHRDCIAEWLSRGNTCPLCRYQLPLDLPPFGGIGGAGLRRVAPLGSGGGSLRRVVPLGWGGRLRRVVPLAWVGLRRVAPLGSEGGPPRAVPGLVLPRVAPGPRPWEEEEEDEAEANAGLLLHLAGGNNATAGAGAGARAAAVGAGAGAGAGAVAVGAGAGAAAGGERHGAGAGLVRDEEGDTFMDDA